MFTPIRVAILAAVFGIAAAVVHSHMALDPPVDVPLPAAAPAPTLPPIALQPGKQRVTQSGLIIIDVQEGKGPVAKVGDTILVHYVGRLLLGGATFDSSVARNQPFQLTLGEHHVIPGWEEGLQGMSVGGQRELVIPPALAYGSTGAGDHIPPNATLVFDVQLMDIVSKK